MHINPQTVQLLHISADEAFPQMRQIRRTLHQHPELSGHEQWTANYIASQCERLGLRVRRNVGGYGLIADLVTDPAKPTVALRLDMDALPIQEINDVPYRSQVDGVMHACGHDIHSAIGIGIAGILSQMVDRLPGNIRFIFQPEEEEITGALRMIRAGALTNPTPIAIFGLHVAPFLAGKMGWTDDLFLAGFDHYLARLVPQPGFEIHPNHLESIARRCCQSILKLNKWHLPSTWPEMQSFWQTMQTEPEHLHRFIIYDASTDEEEPEAWQGYFGIGIKAADPHLRRAALGRIKACLNPICQATHTHYHLETVGTMMDLRNAPHLVQSTLPALKTAIGEENTVHFKAAFPFNCEDFAFYTKHIPGAMYWLGAADPSQGRYAMLHTPDFDVDEHCMITGAHAMAALLLETLLLAQI
jgi:amidohydrolase